MKDSNIVVKCKRAYDPVDATDDYRLLVDGLWPRGVSKQKLKLDEWNKSLAPSDELRKWFDHEPRKWAAFYQKYHSELRASLSQEEIATLLARAKKPGLTLIYGAKDTRYNNAVALKMFIESALLSSK